MIEDTPANEATRVAAVLRDIASHVRIEGDPPTVEVRNYGVNGRGQLLESSGREPDFAAMAKVPDAAMATAVEALRTCERTVAHAHRCVNDGGRSYIQVVDTDAAALTNYVLNGWLEHVAMHIVSDAMTDAVVTEVADALVADTSKRTLAIPVMGIRIGSPIQLPDGPVCRPATDTDRWIWNRSYLEHGERKDLAVCECVIEIEYETAWPPREDHIAVGTFDTEPFAKAVEQVEDALALMRIVTGYHLPIMIAENRIVDLPWVHQRDWLAPSLRDFLRRKDDSPLWAGVELAEDPPADFAARLSAHWTVLQDPTCPVDLKAAVRLMLRDQDWVTLYKVQELLPERLKKPMKKKFESLRRTAGDPHAVSILFARHARPQGDPQNSPMTIKEARELTRGVLESWFASPNPPTP